jgi:hypothetical protein
MNKYRSLDLGSHPGAGPSQYRRVLRIMSIITTGSPHGDIPSGDYSTCFHLRIIVSSSQPWLSSLVVAHFLTERMGPRRTNHVGRCIVN